MAEDSVPSWSTSRLITSTVEPAAVSTIPAVKTILSNGTWRTMSTFSTVVPLPSSAVVTSNTTSPNRITSSTLISSTPTTSSTFWMATSTTSATLTAPPRPWGDSWDNATSTASVTSNIASSLSGVSTTVAPNPSVTLTSSPRPSGDSWDNATSTESVTPSVSSSLSGVSTTVARSSSVTLTSPPGPWGNSWDIATSTEFVASSVPSSVSGSSRTVIATPSVTSISPSATRTPTPTTWTLSTSPPPSLTRTTSPTSPTSPTWISTISTTPITNTSSTVRPTPSPPSTTIPHLEDPCVVACISQGVDDLCTGSQCNLQQQQVIYHDCLAQCGIVTSREVGQTATDRSLSSIIPATSAIPTTTTAPTTSTSTIRSTTKASSKAPPPIRQTISATTTPAAVIIPPLDPRTTTTTVTPSQAPVPEPQNKSELGPLLGGVIGGAVGGAGIISLLIASVMMFKKQKRAKRARLSRGAAGNADMDMNKPGPPPRNTPGSVQGRSSTTVLDMPTDGDGGSEVDMFRNAAPMAAGFAHRTSSPSVAGDIDPVSNAAPNRSSSPAATNLEPGTGTGADADLLRPGIPRRTSSYSNNSHIVDIDSNNATSQHEGVLETLDRPPPPYEDIHPIATSSTLPIPTRTPVSQPSSSSIHNPSSSGSKSTSPTPSVSATPQPIHPPSGLTLHRAQNIPTKTGIFTPSAPDEIFLHNNDIVTVLHRYADGWCRVRNYSRGEIVGMVPAGFLVKVGSGEDVKAGRSTGGLGYADPHVPG